MCERGCSKAHFHECLCFVMWSGKKKEVSKGLDGDFGASQGCRAHPGRMPLMIPSFPCQRHSILLCVTDRAVRSLRCCVVVFLRWFCLVARNSDEVWLCHDPVLACLLPALGSVSSGDTG